MWLEADPNYDPATLGSSDPEEQLKVMEAWFRYRYEDPAERTPHDSSEGGYIWIWGGPYSAHEQLEQEFQGTVSDEVIEELVDKLQRECFEWAPTSSPDDYDTALYDAVRENDKAQTTLDDALSAISSLLALNIAEPAASVHRRLLFANVIAALETFLSDTFINRVLSNDVLFQQYLDTEKAFQDRKFPMRDALRMATEIKALATKELIEMVWHNIDKVKRLYADVISVDLGDIGQVAKAINIRHDIVHRNGRQKDGTDRVIAGSDIIDLIGAVRGLAVRVDLALNPDPILGDPADLPF
jgi:hypothetical protein